MPGLAAAQGNWIGFVDPDDFVDKTYYEKMLRAAKQAGAELAVCNEVLYGRGWKSLCSYQEQPLRTEVLSREEAIHRIRLTPLIQAATRLHRERCAGRNSFFLWAKTMKMHLPHRKSLNMSTAVACIKEKLYHYRLHPASIMHGKVTLKNLDESRCKLRPSCLCTQVWKKRHSIPAVCTDETHAPKHKKKSATQTEKQ